MSFVTARLHLITAFICGKCNFARSYTHKMSSADTRDRNGNKLSKSLLVLLVRSTATDETILWRKFSQLCDKYKVLCGQNEFNFVQLPANLYVQENQKSDAPECGRKAMYNELVGQCRVQFITGRMSSNTRTEDNKTNVWHIKGRTKGVKCCKCFKIWLNGE